MEDRIQLIRKYIEKEREILRESDLEDGIDVDAEDYNPDLATVGRIRALIEYRNIRIEEAWYMKLTEGNNSRENREKLVEYDAERSRRHSLALVSVAGLNGFAERYDMPKFYDGELLKAQDIDTYRNIPVRKAETDFFLKFLNELGEASMRELGSEEEKAERSFLKELQSNVQKKERDYGVKEPIVSDDAEIVFKDDDKFDEFGRF